MQNLTGMNRCFAHWLWRMDEKHVKLLLYLYGMYLRCYICYAVVVAHEAIFSKALTLQHS